MKVLLDSSTLIAAMLPDHVHHGPAHAWLSQAKAGAFELVASGHSLAEVYAVMTTLPRTPRISPAEAWQMLEDNVTSCAQLVTLSGSDYAALIDELASRGIIGGVVYDAVIAKAAELVQVDRLVTLNDAHFRRVWPACASRIVSPLSVTPPSP